MIRNPHAIPELCDADTPVPATADPMIRQTNKKEIKILFIKSYLSYWYNNIKLIADFKNL